MISTILTILAVIVIIGFIQFGLKVIFSSWVGILFIVLIIIFALAYFLLER